MHFIKTLSAGAALIALAVAQGRIAFTSLPSSVSPGQSVPIKWGGGTPGATNIKIDLYEGDYRDLQFVRTLTSMGSNGQFTWNVPADLPDRNDYALFITAGLDNNYSGPFSLTGSKAVSSASSSSSATTSMSAASSASSSSASSSSSATPLTTSGGTVIVQSVVASNTTVTAADNSTTTMTAGAGVVGTGVGASGSAATGTAMSRNTTMAKPTLSSTSSTEAAATTGGSTSAPTTSGGSSGGSGSGSGGSSSGAVAMEVASFASPLALVLSAVAAVMFLA
ncbi:MAG: hypothetical protein Q9168_002566 [Polycauliona sp. 1 TL-2023]